MSAPALGALLVGRTLADRYEIQELIGRGGMSLVYRAFDRRLNRPVAVKIVSLPATDEADQRMLRERLRREAAAAARVPPHPNVVQVYDYGTDMALNLDFIAMELLSGRNLRTVLNAGPLTFAEATRIVRETARGLAAGHRAGIVHRDVKPPNIVVTADDPPGNVKLLDFGIAKVLEEALEEELTRTGHVPHSPAYASPEQRRPGTPVTATSDVYQLALVAREMLTGSRVVDAADEAEAAWSAVPVAVRGVLERAMREEPAERFPDAAAFAEAFSGALEAQSGELALPGTHGPVDDSTRLFDEAGAGELNSRAAPPPAAPRRGWSLRRGLLGAVAALALLVVLRMTIGGNEADPAAAPLAPNGEALEAEFRELMRDAEGNMREAGASLPPEFR